MAENESTREKLIRTAGELLRKEGLEGFSLRKLGSLLGLSAPVIYNHFPDRAALLAEVLDRQFFDEAGAWFAANPSPRDATPLDRLRRLLEFYFMTGLRDPKGYRARFLLQTEGDPMVGSILSEEKSKSEASAALLERVRECIRDGFFKADPGAGTTFFVLWSALHGATLLLAPSDLPEARKKEAAAAVFDAVLRGLAPGESRGGPETGIKSNGEKE